MNQKNNVTTPLKPFPHHMKTFMTRHPVTAPKSMPVTDAAELMEREKIRHLPVIENKTIVGIVSDRNLKQAKLFASSMHLTLDDVMTPEPYCVTVHSNLAEVVATMADRRIGSAIVLNSRDHIVGIFTSTDALNLLSDFIDHSEKEGARAATIEQFISGNIFF